MRLPDGIHVGRGWPSPRRRVLLGVDKPNEITTIPAPKTGRSSAWLERMVRDHEVGGSSPLAPIRPKPLAERDLRVPSDGRECGPSPKRKRCWYRFWPARGCSMPRTVSEQ